MPCRRAETVAHPKLLVLRSRDDVPLRCGIVESSRTCSVVSAGGAADLSKATSLHLVEREPDDESHRTR